MTSQVHRTKISWLLEYIYILSFFFLVIWRHDLLHLFIIIVSHYCVNNLLQAVKLADIVDIAQKMHVNVNFELPI